jgi:hypothetical protein
MILKGMFKEREKEYIKDKKIVSEREKEKKKKKKRVIKWERGE